MSLSFIKKGQAAQAEIQKADAADAEALNRPLFEQRVWLKAGNTTELTFLTGALDKEGILDVPMYWEHQINLNGHWRNWFICTQNEEPCPICEQGDKSSQPMLVGVFVVIDHAEWTTKQGEVIKDQLRLYVAKRDTFKKLQTMATEKKGLVGLRIEVTREDDKAPNVGNLFNIKTSGKNPTLASVLKQFDMKLPPFEEIVDGHYKDAAALKEMGFGSLGGPVGSGGTVANIPDYSKGGGSTTSNAGTSTNKNYADQL